MTKSKANGKKKTMEKKMAHPKMIGKMPMQERDMIEMDKPMPKKKMKKTAKVIKK